MVSGMESEFASTVSYGIKNAVIGLFEMACNSCSDNIEKCYKK